MIKMLVKYPTRDRVSSLIVTFFNGMKMGDDGSKCQRYFGTKKSLSAKWDI